MNYEKNFYGKPNMHYNEYAHSNSSRSDTYSQSSSSLNFGRAGQGGSGHNRRGSKNKRFNFNKPDQCSGSSRETFSTKEKTRTRQYENCGQKYYVCPGCKLSYNYFKSNNILCGRVPRVLPCKHTMCEDCIKKGHNATNHIRCATCNTNVATKNQQNFEYNHFIVGHITCSNMNSALPIDFSNVTLLSTKEAKSDCSKIYESILDQEDKCGLGGCQNSGMISCLDCCGVYCNKCDETLHNSGKHLKNHKRQSYHKFSLGLSQCSLHPMLEDLFCVDCQEKCCCYCMLEKHEGHNRSYLARLSEAEEKELKRIYIAAEEKLAQLQLIQKKMSKPADKVSDIDIEIGQCFTDIHAQLNVIENKLHQEAKQNGFSSSEIDKNIVSQLRSLNYLKYCCDHREEMKLNLRELLNQLKQLENSPNFSNITENCDSPRLVIDQRINDIPNYFKIKTSTTGSPKLVTTVEPSANSEIVEKEINTTSRKGSDSVCSNYSNATFVSCKVESINSDQEVKESINTFEQDIVYVTHVQSLDCVYVQLKKKDKLFKELEREIKKHIKFMSFGVDEVELGELFMAPCVFNKSQWGRVKIIEEIETKDRNTYKVHFIDFGNSSVFTKQELKYISANLAKKEPFAIHCKIDKPNNIEWPENAHIKLAKLLKSKKEIVMFVKKIINNIYVVDLNLNTSSGDLCSVIDLILGGEDGSPSSSKETSSSGSVNQIFDNSEKFKVEESCEIFLRHVLHPWNIYFQKATYENCLTTLSTALYKHYNKSQCDIHILVKDTDVVVNYPSAEYGNWHRARILEVLNAKKSVNVLLVDWGKIVNTSWEAIRRLAEIFKRTECLAIKAKLADVMPRFNNEWSEQDQGAKEFLEKYSVKCKKLKMLVSNIDPLEVVLFEIQPTYDVNINSLLVEHDLVLSSGKLSETVKWPHKNPEEKVDEKLFLPIFKDEDSEDDEIEEEAHVLKTQVEIVRFDDPYSIYVSFVSKKSEAERLNEELQIHYKQEHDVQKSWNVYDKIVVFVAEENCFCRGRIKEMKDDLYRVYLLDRAEDIWVPERDLRAISDYFSKQPNVVLKCHLANIKPAGDSNKWSNLSLEWFQNIFKKYKDLYLKKVSDDKSKSSMPVTMWYAKVIQGTALEPSVHKFMSIDKKVIKAGLAFPVSSQDSVSTNNQVKIKQEPVQLKSQKSLAFVEDKPSITLKNSCDEFSDENLSDEDEVKQIKTGWLPAIPLSKNDFYAYVTCAETEGYLFIREQSLQPLYLEMEETMTKHFNSIPKPKSFTLRPNQMVTVKSNSRWYRGSVLSVIDQNNAKVMMVDFGSDHVVNVDHLHNIVMYPEIPIMVTKIKLYNVCSKTSKWTSIDYDTLLDTVSEYSRIVIRSNINIAIPLADVYDVNGVNLNDKLIELNTNLYRSELLKSEVINLNEPEKKKNESKKWSDLTEEEEEEEFDVKEESNVKTYMFSKLPKLLPGEKVKVDIVSVLNYKTISIFIDEPGAGEEEFVKLSKSLQEAGNLETLTDIKVGTLCISLFQDDDQWYRGIVFNVDEADKFGYVTVFYVDYGNFDIVHISTLRPVKTEWMNFPAKFHIAHIDYLSVDEQVEPFLSKCIQELVGKSKLIEIIEEQPLRIHIYSDESHLHYDAFIREGVVKI